MQLLSPLCSAQVSWDYHHANEMSNCASHMLNLNKQTNLTQLFLHTVLSSGQNPTSPLVSLSCAAWIVHNAWKGNLLGVGTHF